MSDSDDKRVRLANGEIKNTIVKIGGVSFRCTCGCNVFQQPDRDKPQIYRCNACHTDYTAE